MDASGDVGHAPQDGARERRGRRRATLAIGLALLAAGLVATLSHATEQRTGTNGIPARGLFGTSPGRGPICQQGERIPSGTAAVRVSLLGDTRLAPRVAVELSGGSGVVASGATGARWDRASARWFEGSAILVPLGHALHGDLAGDVCIRLLGGSAQQYGLLGVPTAPEEGVTEDGQARPGRLHLEYLAAGERSWWSLAPTLATRIGRGHAWSGASVALLAALLTLTSIAIGAWQLSRDS